MAKDIDNKKKDAVKDKLLKKIKEDYD